MKMLFASFFLLASSKSDLFVVFFYIYKQQEMTKSIFSAIYFILLKYVDTFNFCFQEKNIRFLTTFM